MASQLADRVTAGGPHRSWLTASQLHRGAGLNPNAARLARERIQVGLHRLAVALQAPHERACVRAVNHEGGAVWASADEHSLLLCGLPKVVGRPDHNARRDVDVVAADDRVCLLHRLTRQHTRPAGRVAGRVGVVAVAGAGRRALRPQVGGDGLSEVAERALDEHHRGALVHDLAGLQNERDARLDGAPQHRIHLGRRRADRLEHGLMPHHLPARRQVLTRRQRVLPTLKQLVRLARRRRQQLPDPVDARLVVVGALKKQRADALARRQGRHPVAAVAAHHHLLHGASDVCAQLAHDLQPEQLQHKVGARAQHLQLQHLERHQQLAAAEVPHCIDHRLWHVEDEWALAERVAFGDDLPQPHARRGSAEHRGREAGNATRAEVHRHRGVARLHLRAHHAVDDDKDPGRVAGRAHRVVGAPDGLAALVHADGAVGADPLDEARRAVAQPRQVA
mmetsp:Transcript_40723/g.121470  ORF Transcript_40723/g.121470 Transcript_40723/m.121470 type:complete len:451 (-) Transcript_40723:912-2264(-)